jgi:hypothetical protein
MVLEIQSAHMTETDVPPFGPDRTWFDLIADVLMLAGIVGSVGAIAGEIPALLGYGLLAVALVVDATRDPFLMPLLVLLGVLIYTPIKRAREWGRGVSLRS